MEHTEIEVRSLYERHARSCDPKDFEGQVMRVAMDQHQRALMVEGIGRGLDIGPEDILLDLCCGNGAITDPVFARCRGGLGIDFTPYLIEVAKINFERPPSRLYRLADVLEHLETTDDAERFTKALCYGAFQCLMESKATGVLLALRSRFPNVRRVFLGNLPDLDRVEIFWPQYVGSEPWSLADLRRHDSPLGIWRTEEEVRKLTTSCGWHAEISRMPPGFYSAHYRFDATLTAA
jgi:hypothetical protein